MVATHSQESAARIKINASLSNLGWNMDEDDPACNVYTERAKTLEQNLRLKRKQPDYLLYRSNTDDIIAAIEAKRKGKSLDDAIDDAIEKYANPLGIKIVFASDGVFVKSHHVEENKPLTIDDDPLTEFPSETRLLRFLNTGSEIAIPKTVQNTREELIKIFKWANELLRKDGLRNLERFVEFSNILFIKIISELEEDRVSNGGERLLDKELCWESFYNMESPKTMLNYINNTVLKNGLAKKYNHSDDIFQETLGIKDPDTVKSIVDKLSNLTLLNTESEVKGDAFEYFLKQLATGNDLGEYFTPRHIIKLIVTLVNPKFGNAVFDPFCGTGGFLIEAFRHIKRGIDENNQEYIAELKNYCIFGIEITNTYKIAKMNMIITGDGHNNIIRADTGKNEYWEHKDLKKIFRARNINGFNVILSNIPYGQEPPYGNQYPIPSKSGDSIFIQHIISALKDGGKCGVIVPDGLLTTPNHKKTREYLLNTCNLDAVISLPMGVFLPYTNTKTNILIFTKGKPTKKVWYYSIENDGFELTTRRRRIVQNDIPDVIDKFPNREVSTKSFSVLLDDIKNNNYNLAYTAYKTIELQNTVLQDPLLLISELEQIEKKIFDDMVLLREVIHE